MRRAFVMMSSTKHFPITSYAEQWDGTVQGRAEARLDSSCRSNDGPRKRASPTRNCFCVGIGRARVDEHHGGQGGSWVPAVRYVEKKPSCCRRIISGRASDHADHLRRIGLRRLRASAIRCRLPVEAFILFRAIIALCARRLTAQLMRVESCRGGAAAGYAAHAAHKVIRTPAMTNSLLQRSLVPAGHRRPRPPRIRRAWRRAAATNTVPAARQEVQALSRSMREGGGAR